ncbi:uncharacterized protein K460DRAFT_322379 [Cucurbitaria berberidis CBS 394.84]|uniref:Uncharacterized protein n=1 Tax=Cucurbitaria berberidis CBS 394.84 TaxID=1168544 RepID=A0A9P4G9E2_9PLEO|nr:uncharacterized protein K460DRAFT_322379 [Cucurbitaria berberidis CBS 394.84]KAF1841286.1 hypothetical protein K460DRAFT_322379 [Cucurbitaria berberidis CBS 394.84]
MRIPVFQNRPSSGHSKPTYRRDFLWAIGLNVLNDLWLRLRGYKLDKEPKKSIYRSSRWKALQRCAVHILPCLVSLIMATLQLRHYYMGKEITGARNSTSLYMAMLQVAAKTQELLMIASLATIVVHRLRIDLLDGPGIPFGLLGATSLFNQISFFWSSAFIGSSRAGGANAGTPDY